MRTRIYIVASVLYILLGLVIAVRSVLAHVPIIAVLGIVFIALGIVRLRDYVAWVGRPRT